MATTLTATAESADARVLLTVVNTPPPSSEFVTFERSIDGGATWTLVRSEVPMPMTIGATRNASVYDYEMPLDVATLYRATPDNGGAVDTDGPVTVVSGGMVWLKDPARPWANIALENCLQGLACADKDPALSLRGLGEEVRAADAGLMPVLNRVLPVDVWAVRKGIVSSMQIVSMTDAARVAVETFFAAGGPIFLQLPAEYGWADRYWQPGDTTAARISRDMRRPYRLWDVPLVEIDAPVGPGQGTACNNWCALADTFATYADMTATGLTWQQVFEGDAVC